MPNYSPAPEVRKIAEDLIPKYHAHLDEAARIEYVFRDEAANDGGKTVFGKARKVVGLNAYLAADQYFEQPTLEGHEAETVKTPIAQDFFVLEIAADVWKHLDDNQREALVDHELCHFGLSFNDEGERKLSIIPHDVEEFASVVRRHGLWRVDVEQFINAATGQLKLVVGGDSANAGDVVTREDGSKADAATGEILEQE